MIWLVLLLVATNLVAVAVAVGLWRLRPTESEVLPAELLSEMGRQPAAGSGTRRIITVEILNPIELAGTRGRVVGVAGSLAPGLTRRIVYDQAAKTMRRQLAEQRVVAEVRLHALRPVPAQSFPAVGDEREVSDLPAVDRAEPEPPVP